MNKLSLNKETVLTLSPQDVQVVGGRPVRAVISEEIPCIPQTEFPGCWTGLCITYIDCDTLI